MADHGSGWEILGIRQLAATDQWAEEFAGTLLIHRRDTTEPVEPIAVTVKRSVVIEMEAYLAQLLKRSRGVRGA